MFRDCYFEYAGVYSGDYNLTMTYVENSYDKFDSGGTYEPVTDVLPNSAESLLYGLKYSENPLEFSIEIVNIDDVISVEQMCTIKNWLFGQDGWKTLRIMDEDLRPYHLSCLFIPDEDIVDGSGYRGIRCTLKNVSPFWYGDEETITFTREDLIKMAQKTNSDGRIDDEGNISNAGNIWTTIHIKGQDPCRIYPIIKFKAPNEESGASGKNYMRFRVENNLGDTEKESRINFYLVSDWDEYDYTVDMKYMTCTRRKNDEEPMPFLYSPVNKSGRLLYFETGDNRIAINVRQEPNNTGETGKFTPYDYLSFSYIPKYRLGGF